MTDMWTKQKPAILAMVFLAIAMLLFPGVILTGVGDILNWTGTGGNITQFTGLQSIVEIWPMLVLVVVVFASLATIAVGGMQAYKREEAGEMILMAMIMMLIFMITFTITLDAVDQALATAGISSYTGLESILKIVPMLTFVVIGFESLALVGGGIYTKVAKNKK